MSKIPPPWKLKEVPIVVDPDNKYNSYLAFWLTAEHAKELIEAVTPILERDGVVPGDPNHSLSVLVSLLQNLT